MSASKSDGSSSSSSSNLRDEVKQVENVVEQEHQTFLQLMQQMRVQQEQIGKLTQEVGRLRNNGRREGEERSRNQEGMKPDLFSGISNNDKNHLLTWLFQLQQYVEELPIDQKRGIHCQSPEDLRVSVSARICEVHERLDLR